MRREGDFSQIVREAVIDRGVCSECGMGKLDDDPWRVHHRVFLASEAAKQFPLIALQSIYNANLMHNSCHNSYHTEVDEPPQSEIDAVKNEFEKSRKEARKSPVFARHQPRLF